MVTTPTTETYNTTLHLKTYLPKQQELVLALESAVLQLDGLEPTMNEKSHDLFVEKFTKINMTLVTTFMSNHEEEGLSEILLEKIKALNDLILEVFPGSEGPSLANSCIFLKA